MEAFFRLTESVSPLLKRINGLLVFIENLNLMPNFETGWSVYAYFKKEVLIASFKVSTPNYFLL
jgi:hypothetical protein